jgi:PAS domain S-box-containing protein
MRGLSRWLIRCACLLAGAVQCAGPAQALDAVTLQLKWTHAFQFAGYYAAKEKGYYREVGLDVRIDEAHPGHDPVKTVLEGRAQFGVGTSALLLARNAGKPVVALAVIFQHSPYVLIARRHDPAQTIHDLVGKRVMLEPQADEIVAYLKQEGISPGHFEHLEHSYDVKDLIDGKTDAIAAYATNQPYYLDRARIAYQIYTPRSAGIDFYGDNLFTTEQELRQRPERVAAFRAASLRGWQYAMEHPEEIIDLILANYSRRHTRDYFRFEARQMIPLLRPELIEVGYMYPGRWRHMAETYADIGMLARDFSLDGFLYDPHPRFDLAWVYRTLAIALLLMAVAGAVVLYVHRNNRRLAGLLARHESTEMRLQKLSQAVEQSPAATVITDIAGRIEYVNPKFLEITGYGHDELIGKTPDLIKSDLTAPEVYADLWRTILSGREWRGDMQNRKKNGELYWEHEIISAVKDDRGEIVNFVAVKEDITERKRMEEALQQEHASLLATERKLLEAHERLAEADRLESVGRLAAGVAHEVKNPLTIIRLGVDYLAMHHTQESNRAVLDDVRGAVDRADSVLRDLLDISRQKPFARREIALEQVIDNSVRFVAHETKRRNVAIVIRRGEPLPHIHADPDRLIQVFINLLANAAQAIGQDGSIEIVLRTACLGESDLRHSEMSAFRPGEQVIEVEIRDDGPGFPPEHENKLFEPFFTTKPMGEGTGLGLAVARNIVIMHGGTIDVANRPEGGAVARLVFRVERERTTNE